MWQSCGELKETKLESQISTGTDQGGGLQSISTPTLSRRAFMNESPTLSLSRLPDDSILCI